MGLAHLFCAMLAELKNPLAISWGDFSLGAPINMWTQFVWPALRMEGWRCDSMEALSREAITRMERTLTEVEKTSGNFSQGSGCVRDAPAESRLVTLLAKQCNVPVTVFPEVARRSGNLGSSTCGVAFQVALESAAKVPVAARKPIFLASLGPGLLYGGGWLRPAADVA
jgi:hypothetical protein